jgi:hypothetical protein
MRIAIVALLLLFATAEIASAQYRTCTSTYNPYTRQTITTCY